MSQESILQKALTTRINLQVVVSSVPAVKEHMDASLSRWLDSVPLPPEMPGGTPVHFRVGLASDLTRLRWSAFGHPAGYIPKMSDYFNKCGISAEDLALINSFGDDLDPDLVGSWITVADGAVRTGWQFCDPRMIGDLAPHLGSGEVTTILMSWLSKHNVDTFRRFAQSIGTEASSEIELVMPGDAIDDQVALVRSAFEDLGGASLPDAAAEAAGAAAGARLGVSVVISDGTIDSVSMNVPRVGADIVAGLCSAVGIGWDDKIGELQRGLRADGMRRFEYRERGGQSFVDVTMIPGEVEQVPDLGKN